MEYNTQRPTMPINDYGRNIYKLIQYAKTIPDRDRRTQMAAAIVEMMARTTTDTRAAGGSKRKYWVHLMNMANWELDVDIPYPITPDENMRFDPNQMPYNSNHIRYRHYGTIMERAIERVSEYPEGEERDELLRLIAHGMKRDYLWWNNDTVEDSVIDEQLSVLSGGKLHLPDDFRFMDKAEYIKGMEETLGLNPSRKKRKRKKKKQN